MQDNVKLENEFFNFFQNKSFEDIEREYNEHGLSEKNKKDKGYANEHQKHWEILLGLYLKEKLKDAFCRPAGEEMPDFLYTKDNKKIWFECMASSEGNLKNQFWQPPRIKLESSYTREKLNEINKMSYTISDTLRPYQLRYYHMLQYKEGQCTDRIKDGIINKNDFNILCINGYLFEQNDLPKQESNLQYETFCGRKVYRNIQDSTALGKLSNVLFGLTPRSDTFRTNDGGRFYFEGPYGYKFFHKTKNGDEIYKSSYGYYRFRDSKKLDITEEDVKRDYLQCNFFCREDFPFNGILFSNVSYDWKNRRLIQFELESRKQTRYNGYSLYYLQNPMKENCMKYFENLCECINCDVFYNMPSVYFDL